MYRLGDAVKKLCELELLKEEQQTNSILHDEIALLEARIKFWPLKETTPLGTPALLVVLRSQLKIHMVKLQQYEKEVIVNCQAPEIPQALQVLKMSLGDYFSTLQECRNIVGRLNALGVFNADQVSTSGGSSDVRESNSQPVHQQCDSGLSYAGVEEQ